MTTLLPRDFIEKPVAHRGLHDGNVTCAENSCLAARRAFDAGYGVEIDLQLSADGKAIVFHDDTLDRMTGETGPVISRTAAELEAIALVSGGETILTLERFLKTLPSGLPLLVELKDQDGALGENVGVLEADVARQLADYAGPLAVMSMNPHSMSAMQTLAPDIPRGLTVDGFKPEVWNVPIERLASLEAITDYARVGACFISHNHRYLDNPRVEILKSEGAAVLCWTIRSQQEAASALAIADNITFEGFLP